MVAGWDDPHHVDPRSTEDCVVRGLDVDHEKLNDDIVWIGADGSEIVSGDGVSFSSSHTSWTEFEG